MADAVYRLAEDEIFDAAVAVRTEYEHIDLRFLD